jgi:predicted nucleic acid-binding protein
MTDDTLVAADRLVGHRQVTDAHLVAVAISHDGLLATFDRGVVEVVPEAFRGQGRVMVLR